MFFFSLVIYSTVGLLEPPLGFSCHYCVLHDLINKAAEGDSGCEVVSPTLDCSTSRGPQSSSRCEQCVNLFLHLFLSLSRSLFPGCEEQSRALEINHIRMDAWLLMGAVFVSYMHDEQPSLGRGRQLWRGAAAHSKRVA